MIKISTIFGLGVLVALNDYLGLPSDWKKIIYLVSGILIAVLSWLIRNELNEVIRHLHTEHIKADTFSQNTPKQEEVSENK